MRTSITAGDEKLSAWTVTYVELPVSMLRMLAIHCMGPAGTAASACAGGAAGSCAAVIAAHASTIRSENVAAFRNVLGIVVSLPYFRFIVSSHVLTVEKTRTRQVGPR
jgi:hypothetical protein